MKKIWIILLFLHLKLLAIDDISEEVRLSEGRFGLSVTYNLEDSNTKALVLAVPGFRLNPKTMRFALNMFAERGIPGLLVKFDAYNEEIFSPQDIVQESLSFALDICSRQQRKLILVGHSTGASYLSYVVGQLEKDQALPNNVNIFLVMYAPADLFKDRALLATPIQKLLSGDAPYPDIRALCFYYIDDLLLDLAYLNSDERSNRYPKCQNICLGEQGFPMFAHNFAHLIQMPKQRSEMFVNIANYFSLEQ